MPRFIALYVGTSKAGHHIFRHVVGPNSYRDHNWLHRDYNEVPKDLKLGQVYSFDALTGVFHGHQVLRAACDFEVLV